jgi:hypothetical protein
VPALDGWLVAHKAVLESEKCGTDTSGQANFARLMTIYDEARENPARAGLGAQANGLRGFRSE